MSSTPPVRDPKDPSINPAMQAQIDKSHGTEFSGTDPMDTVSVKDPDEGRSWPLICSPRKWRWRSRARRPSAWCCR